MWLARILREQEDVVAARAAYLSIYQTNAYGLELLTDLMALSSQQKDTELLEQLKPKAVSMLGSSVWGHLSLVRTLRSVNDLDLAQQYIEAGERLIPNLETPEQQEEYRINFNKERHHLAVARRYRALEDETPTNSFIETMTNLAVDLNHTAFLT